MIPVLDRPHRITPLVRSIIHTTDPEHTVTEFVRSPGYPAEAAAVTEGILTLVAHGHHGRSTVLPEDERHGDYARKVNVAVAPASAEWYFLGADDIEFQPGWWKAAMAVATPTTDVIGVCDCGDFVEGSVSRRQVRDQLHAVHCLVSRRYLERGTIDDPTKLLHEGYPHEIVDMEFTATARHRGVWAYAEDSHVEHVHHRFGKAPRSEYSNSRVAHDRLRQGRHLYRQRCHLWGEENPAL